MQKKCIKKRLNPIGPIISDYYSKFPELLETPYLCKMGQSAAKLEGKFGVVTVTDSFRKGYRLYYNIICNRCGKKSHMRADHIKNKPKSCKHCVNDLQIEQIYIKNVQRLSRNGVESSDSKRETS